MHDCFGSTGFLAAYNGGPARFEQHLATRNPLSKETIDYVAAVTAFTSEWQGGHASRVIRRAVPWRVAPLFVERAGAR